MKIRHIVVTAVTALLLTTGKVWAKNDSHPVQPVHPTKGGHHKAPGINAVSGTGAIALLTGGLLLAGKRVRSRRAR